MKKFQYYIPIALQKAGYALFYVLYTIFVRIEIRGTENITRVLENPALSGRPIILASNHTSELDVTAMPLVLPFFSPLFPIYFVSMQTEKYKTFGWRSYIYGGIFFNMLGGYAVHSGNHDYAVALEDHIKILKQPVKGRQRRTLWIAPEGKRTRDGQMNPARGGLGFLVYDTNAVIVPVAIDTFFNITMWDFFTFRRKVIITVGAPMTRKKLIATKTPQVDDFRRAGQIVLDRIEEMMKQ